MNVFVHLTLMRFDDLELAAEVESAVDRGAPTVPALLHVLRADDADSDDWELLADPTVLTDEDRHAVVAIGRGDPGEVGSCHVDLGLDAPSAASRVDVTLAATGILPWAGSMPMNGGWQVFRPAPDLLLIARAVPVASEQAFAEITAAEQRSLDTGVDGLPLDSHRERQRALTALLSAP